MRSGESVEEAFSLSSYATSSAFGNASHTSFNALEVVGYYVITTKIHVRSLILSDGRVIGDGDTSSDEAVVECV